LRHYDPRITSAVFSWPAEQQSRIRRGAPAALHQSKDRSVLASADRQVEGPASAGFGRVVAASAGPLATFPGKQTDGVRRGVTPRAGHCPAPRALGGDVKAEARPGGRVWADVRVGKTAPEGSPDAPHERLDTGEFSVVSYPHGQLSAHACYMLLDRREPTEYRRNVAPSLRAPLPPGEKLMGAALLERADPAAIEPLPAT
jgi:hypothetical protein